MVEHDGSFVWYELITTDMAAAATFYADVVGWGAQDASTPDLAYTLFTVGSTLVGGLMGLPEDARKMGATPRWMGFVGVNDVDAAAERIERRTATSAAFRSSPTRKRRHLRWSRG
jgi:uncharacterized protein